MKDRIRASFTEIRADDALIDNTMTYLRGELDSWQRESKRFSLPMKVVAVAAMAVLAVGIFAYNLYFTAAAHISIDINPSVELTLNRFDDVVEAYAFNEDGALILSGAGLRGKTYSEAVGMIISATHTNGYMTEDALVSVTVQAASYKKEQTLCEALSRFINEKIMPAQPSAEFEVYPVTADIWSDAHSHHMSPAKYLAIQELMDVDENAAIVDYSDSTVRQIRRRTQECHNMHNTESNHGNSESVPGNGHGHGNNH